MQKIFWFANLISVPLSLSLSVLLYLLFLFLSLVISYRRPCPLSVFLDSFLLKLGTQSM